MGNRAKDIGVLLLVMLAGLVVGFFLGGLIADAAANVAALSWLGFLAYFRSFGLDNFGIDLMVIRINFGFRINFSLMGVICMLLFMFVYLRRRG